MSTANLIEYFAYVLNVILAFFGVETAEEFVGNIISMFSGLFGYEPEV